MIFTEIYAENTLERMCESFRDIVIDYGTKNDKEEIKSLDKSDFTILLNQIKSEKLSDNDIKNCFLTQCIESYSFSDDVILEAKKRLQD